jgi:hypothetical protein
MPRSALTLVPSGARWHSRSVWTPDSLSEIVAQIILAAIHPASNDEHEESQCIGHHERLLARDAHHQSAVDDSPGHGRIFAPYEVVLTALAYSFL